MLTKFKISWNVHCFEENLHLSSSYLYNTGYVKHTHIHKKRKKERPCTFISSQIHHSVCVCVFKVSSWSKQVDNKKYESVLLK